MGRRVMKWGIVPQPGAEMPSEGRFCVQTALRLKIQRG